MKNIKIFIFITMAYIFSHGLTALLVTPIQEKYLTDITVFASLIYLPHGVRVLATWLCGWRAFLPLCLGAFLSELIFTPAPVHELIAQALWYSIVVGAASPLVAFELMRLTTGNLYASTDREMNWKCLLFIGAVASILNSAGQSIVFSGVILPDHAVSVFLTYAIGDLAGLFVSMLALMMMFRWIRLITETRGDG